MEKSNKKPNKKIKKFTKETKAEIPSPKSKYVSDEEVLAYLIACQK